MDGFRALRMGIAAALAAVALFVPSSAQALVFQVTTATDADIIGSPSNGECQSTAAGNPCTLRAAIKEANGTPGPDEVALPALEFQLTLPGVLTINEDQSSLTIRGAGARATTLREVNTTGVISSDSTGQVTIADLTITGGRALSGGGIYQGAAGSLLLRRVSVSNNQVLTGGNGFGGGIAVAAGELSLAESLIASNTISADGAATGGGIWASSGTLVSLTNTTVYDNHANSTCSGLGCNGFGGGMTLFDGSITNTTLASNSVSAGSSRRGGNLFLQDGTLTAKNSIAINGAATSPEQNCVVTGSTPHLNVEGRNFQFGPGSCTGFTTADPQLGPLANNGGPTDTLVPAPGSPAIDGALGGCPPPSTDQRGNPRPLGAACDVGPTEWGADLQVTMTADKPAPLDPNAPVTFSATVTNNGPDDAPNVLVAHTLPAGTSLLAGLASVGTCSGALSCNVGTLARGGSATVQAAISSLAPPAATDTVSVVGLPPDPNGTNNFTSLTLAVGPQAQAPQGRIAVTSVSMLRTRFRVGRAATPISRATAKRRPPPRGTAFRYTLSEAAPVSIRIERTLSGRRVGSRCVRPTRANRRRPKCTRYATKGTLRRNSKAGRNSVTFSGRIGTRRLAPNRYRATIVAGTGARASQARRVSFTIVAG